MPSRTLRPTQVPAPAPFAYTVAAPDGFTPEAVFASWDGSGAGGDFLPCVSYYNADRVLLDRAFPTTGAVTAGDSADVGYRPFERGGGGGGTPGAALETTDGATTINPTTELFIGAGLELGGGGGVATVAERQVPFFMARAFNLAIPNGGNLFVDFHTAPNVNAWTNDVPAEPGYRTAEGAAFVNSTTWVGDNFRGNVTGPQGAFRIRPDRPGVYIVTVTGIFRAIGGAGTIDLFTVTNGAGQPRAGTTQNMALVGSQVVYAVTVPLVYFAAAPATVTEIYVLINNNSGQASDPANTRVEVTAYRMSPA